VFKLAISSIAKSKGNINWLLKTIKISLTTLCVSISEGKIIVRSIIKARD